MKISVKWLKEFVDFDYSIDELADKLTMAGLEVELIERLGSEFDNVVIGKVEKIRRHPNADKLVLCDVDVGEDSLLQIICGAPNVREGFVAPVALVGAKLKSGMEIKKTKIRGQVSYGMLCSERELGISDEASGLMELSEDYKIGAPFAREFGLDDVVIELELTPNRSDALSMIGVARDVSAITGNPLKLPEIKLDESETPVASTSVATLTSVEILDPELCPRYVAKIIRNVKIGPSPDWMQTRLKMLDIGSINNVVDATNYVLLEMGHPLHAFDYHKLAENRIFVRRARQGENIITIDGEQRDLTTDMLVIADAEKPVALAGIMGGLESEITDDTTNILLESAYFDPVSIRKTSKTLKMSTGASYRFERGADIGDTIRAANRAAQLIQELAGGEICKGVVDAYPEKRDPLVLKFRPERANYLLGTKIEPAEMREILTLLGFSVTDNFEVTVPTYRPDVTREVDLIEEIARVHGYDKIPTIMPSGDIPEAHPDQKSQIRDRVKEIMLECGLSEAINYSFYGKDAFDLIELQKDDKLRKVVEIDNPLSIDQSVMRTTLIPCMLENVRWNLNHQVDDIKLFEIGRVFIPKGDDELPDEHETVAGVVSGKIGDGVWCDKARQADFFDIKGLVEILLNEFRIDEYTLERLNHPLFHPGQNAQIIIEQDVLGVFGEVHPKVLENYDIDQKVYVFEFDLETLFKHVKDDSQARRLSYQPLSAFPSIARDIAIIVDEGLSSEHATEIIRSAGGKLVKSIRLFDVYTGEQVPEGKKSLAWSIEYHSKDRTLTDEEVDAVHSKIIDRLEKEVDARLREEHYSTD